MEDECKMEKVVLQENGIVRNQCGEVIGHMSRTIKRDDIVAAVAQGWCSPENEHKEMDVELADEIVRNVWNIL